MAPAFQQVEAGSGAKQLPPYPDRFYIAAQYAAVPGTVEVDRNAAHATRRFMDLTKLLFYSLFQQAVNGPCNVPKPWFLNVVENARWSSWKELGDMPPIEAMRLFVRTLEDEDPDWWQRAQLAPGDPIDFPISSIPYDYYDDDENAVIAQELFFVPDNQWEAVNATGRKPSPRYQHATALINCRMFVVGGNSNGRYLSDVHVLDLSTLAWSKVDIVPSDPIDALPPSAGHALVRLDNKTLLAIGGHTRKKEELLQVRALDLQTRQWSLVPTKGTIPSARGGHSVNQLDTKLYIFGGEDPERAFLDDVFCLDTETWAWSSLATAGTGPSPRSEHSAIIYDDKFLTVFGGGSHSRCFNDLFLLDLETLSWSSPQLGGSLPGARAGHKGVLVGSSWFIVGGGDNKGGHPETLSIDMESLTCSVVATATAKSPIVSEGLSLVAIEVPDSFLLLAFGGYNGRYGSQLYALRPAQESPNPLPTLPATAAILEASSGAGHGGVDRQLEEAAELAAQAEKQAMDARAEANYVAAKARADAWAVIGKAKLDESDLQLRLEVALEDLAGLQEHNTSLEQALSESQAALSQAELELTQLRSEFSAAKAKGREEEREHSEREMKSLRAGLADTDQELHALRGNLAGEQARCFRLEVEVAELRQKLQKLDALEAELALLRRQKSAADEAMASQPKKSEGGWMSWK